MTARGLCQGLRRGLRRGTAPGLRRVGEGADIARTAAFLAAPESDYITGQAISVNGGAQMS